MKEFSRIAWVSEASRALWQPRLEAASNAWLEAELRSVDAGLRPAALTFQRPAGTALEVSPGRWAYGPKAAELARAFAAGDDRTIGQLLGFPSCCVEFFQRTWAAGVKETVHAMGDPNGPVECNILGRWLGIRWVTHLPCSFACEASRQVGLSFRSIVDRETAATVDEVLSWPVEWNALHGMAEIKMPVVKVVASTTYTPAKVTVRRPGTRWPVEGARGLVFPYTERERLAPKAMTFLRPSDNGFQSTAAMDAAHAMLLGALRADRPLGRVVDLGCGNGLLLQKVKDEFGHGVEGVEHMEKAALVPVLRQSIATWSDTADTLIVSVRRFEENPGLRERCLRSARQVLEYSYDEPVFARIVPGLLGRSSVEAAP
jgi:hypothetical protein